MSSAPVIGKVFMSSFLFMSSFYRAKLSSDMDIFTVTSKYSLVELKSSRRSIFQTIYAPIAYSRSRRAGSDDQVPDLEDPGLPAAQYVAVLRQLQLREDERPRVREQLDPAAQQLLSATEETVDPTTLIRAFHELLEHDGRRARGCRRARRCSSRRQGAPFERGELDRLAQAASQCRGGGCRSPPCRSSGRHARAGGRQEGRAASTAAPSAAIEGCGPTAGTSADWRRRET